MVPKAMSTSHPNPPFHPRDTTSTSCHSTLDLSSSHFLLGDRKVLYQNPLLRIRRISSVQSPIEIQEASDKAKERKIVRVLQSLCGGECLDIGPAVGIGNADWVMILESALLV